MNCLVGELSCSPKKVIWLSRALKLPKEKSQNRKFRMVARCIFFFFFFYYYFLFTDKKKQGRRVDPVSVGLVETRVFALLLTTWNIFYRMEKGYINLYLKQAKDLTLQITEGSLL